MEHDSVQLAGVEEAVAADGRILRRRGFERAAGQVAGEDDVDRRGVRRSSSPDAIESTIVIGPSKTRLSSMPTSSRSSRRRASARLFARLHPAARGAASTPCPASRAGRGEGDPASGSAADTRMRGSAGHQPPDEPWPRGPRSLWGNASTSTSSTSGSCERRELRDPHAWLDRERSLASVFKRSTRISPR